NYPNPFNPETNIEYHLKKAGNVELTIYNSLGQKVRTLVNMHQTSGVYTERWDGKNNSGIQMPTGVYYYAIKAGNFQQMHKMLLMK
ncbi:MAG: T9SS type A sorting domain-containing protein, partial [Calditrichia bacterium]|nr:T9SS type A sorting domain-containing protein [Calditrichia bacterium]